MKMYCPKCYKLNPDENQFCSQCGHRLSSDTNNTAPISSDIKYCSHCGSEILAAAVVCPHCGCQVEGARHSEDKPLVILDLIALLFPIIGLIMYFVFHHNYPNKAKSVGIAALVGFLIAIIFPIIFVMIIQSL